MAAPSWVACLLIMRQVDQVQARALGPARNEFAMACSDSGGSEVRLKRLISSPCSRPPYKEILVRWLLPGRWPVSVKPKADSPVPARHGPFHRAALFDETLHSAHRGHSLNTNHFAPHNANLHALLQHFHKKPAELPTHTSDSDGSFVVSGAQ